MQFNVEYRFRDKRLTFSTKVNKNFDLYIFEYYKFKLFHV